MYPIPSERLALVASSAVLHTDEKFASMVASSTHAYQSKRKIEGRAPTVDSLVSSMSKMSEADLKEAMKRAGLLK